MKAHSRESFRLKVFISGERREIGHTKGALVEVYLQQERAGPGAGVFLADL
jgi:hypothetical protein